LIFVVFKVGFRMAYNKPIVFTQLGPMAMDTKEITAQKVHSLQSPATTVNVTTFTSTSSARILPANGARKGLIINNLGGGTLYVLLGPGTASSTNCSIPPVNAGNGCEIDFKYCQVEITGILSATGSAVITELT
jgi:hypothetical protein